MSCRNNSFDKHWFQYLDYVILCQQMQRNSNKRGRDRTSYWNGVLFGGSFIFNQYARVLKQYIDQQILIHLYRSHTHTHTHTTFLLNSHFSYQTVVLTVFVNFVFVFFFSVFGIFCTGFYLVLFSSIDFSFSLYF